MRVRSAFILAVLMLTLGRMPAAAQVVGTFAWQTQPYCNRLTVTVVQQGGVYQLVGSDDQCGASGAPLTGTAIPTTSGVALGVTVALPTGRSAHLSASFALATLSGTWSDADGNSGLFAFGGVTPGVPRPAPIAATAIVPSQFSPSVYAGTGAATTVARSDHTHDARYYTKAETDAAIATSHATGKWIPISPAGIATVGGTYQPSAGSQNGLALNDEVDATFNFGFTLPPDYTPGTSLQLRMVFTSETSSVGCQFLINTNTLSVTRPTAGVTTNGTLNRLQASTVTNPGFEKPFVVTSPIAIADLNAQPGDALNIGYFRQNDSCPNVLMLHGVQITYF